jgi:hypothetical protein
MDSIDFARRLLERYDQEIASVGATIVSGSMPDHTAYKAAVGQREGLRRARAVVVEMLGPSGRDVELDITLGGPGSRTRRPDRTPSAP